MGWPRKDEGARVYFERKAKSYVLVFPEDRCPDGTMEGVGEVLIDNDPDVPRLATTGVSDMFLYRHCRRAQWDEMPQAWQDALGEWLVDPPTCYRGLWRVETLKESLAA